MKLGKKKKESPLRNPRTLLCEIYLACIRDSPFFKLYLFLFLPIERIPGIFTDTENDVHTMEIGK